MFDFENPAAFFLLFLIAILYFLRWAKVFGHISFPIILSNWNGDDFKWSKPIRSFLSILVHILTLAGFIASIIAFANPVKHHQEKVYTSRGAEIVFVVDTSPSMAAKDIGGQTRLEAARNAIKLLAEENGGNSLGLVEMAKEAAMVVPPTMSRSVFYDKLDSLMIGELGDGTAIGNGLSCAVYHLLNSSAPKKSIVLITDGENNAGAIHPFTAARLAKEKNITLYVLGIGTKGIVPLEYTDPVTGKVYAGNLDSNYDSANLSKIAFEANGSFYEIVSMNALSQALSTISKNENVVQSYHIRNQDESFALNFLMMSALFLIIAWVIRRLILQEVL